MTWNPPSTETAPKPARPERPLGVTILTIWDGMTIGLFPLLMTTISLTRGGDQTQVNLLTCLTLGLSSAILFTAIGAWRGHDGSRLGLILLLVIYYSTRAFSDVTILASGSLTEEKSLDAIGRLLRYAIICGVNAWYFLHPKTLQFYRYPKDRKLI